MTDIQAESFYIFLKDRKMPVPTTGAVANLDENGLTTLYRCSGNVGAAFYREQVQGYVKGADPFRPIPGVSQFVVILKNCDATIWVSAKSANMDGERLTLFGDEDGHIVAEFFREEVQGFVKV